MSRRHESRRSRDPRRHGSLNARGRREQRERKVSIDTFTHTIPVNNCQNSTKRRTRTHKYRTGDWRSSKHRTRWDGESQVIHLIFNYHNKGGNDYCEDLILILWNFFFRLHDEPYDDDAIYGVMANESGYSSRVEMDGVFTNGKQSFKDESSISEKSNIDQFYMYRKKKKMSFVGEDKFNKLSDEMILSILKWLPKKCLVRGIKPIGISILLSCRFLSQNFFSEEICCRILASSD